MQSPESIALRIVVSLILMVLLAASAVGADDATGGATLIVENGLVLREDGRGFERRDLFIEDGTFVERRPDVDVRVIDAKGRHVIPPLADAHTHRFSRSADARDSRRLFLEHGFLYVANLCCPSDAREATSRFTNRPDGVDVLFANGAITAPNGHPIALYRSLHRRRGGQEDTFLAEYEDNTFYVVASREDLARKWRMLEPLRPDLVKIILSDSEVHEPTASGRRDGGLDPGLVPAVVTRARAAGIRVVAHVNSAVDFRVAMAAGVELIAHTPGFGARPGQDETAFRLTRDDARAALARGTSVITTAGAYDGRDDNSFARAIVTHNLKQLDEAGVPILFGTDEWFGPELELRALPAIGFSPEALVRMLTKTTPRALYPERRLGALRPGFEGSLVILAGNPLDDFAQVTSARLVVKRGRVLLDRR